MKKYLIGALVGSILGGGSFALAQTSDDLDRHESICSKAVEANLNADTSYLERWFDSPPVTSQAQRLQIYRSCIMYSKGWRAGYAHAGSNTI